MRNNKNTIGKWQTRHRDFLASSSPETDKEVILELMSQANSLKLNNDIDDSVFALLVRLIAENFIASQVEKRFDHYCIHKLEPRLNQMMRSAI